MTSNSENIETVISKYSHSESELPPFSISPEDLNIIQEVFTDEKDLKHIFDTLDSHSNQKLLKPYLDILNSSCPISLRVIFEQLKRGKNLSYKDNLIMDLRIATRYFIIPMLDSCKMKIFLKESKPPLLINNTNNNGHSPMLEPYLNQRFRHSSRNWKET